MGNVLRRRKPSAEGSIKLELPVAGNAPKRSDNYVKTSRYTFYNFLFKCTAEQFRNLSNVYFLVISLLALVGTNTDWFESPYSASGTLVGLVLVVGFTMAFEGYYDVKRHREDKEVNNRIAYRLRPGDGHVERIHWADVRPGDLLKVYDRAAFPADLLFVTSCAVGNKCYVETSNIDGETNLKIKHVAKDLVERCLMPDQAASLRATLTYDLPSAILTFSGSMRVFDDKRYMTAAEIDASPGYKDVSLDTANLLLRGSVLRNTPWVLGIVLYAGSETKVVQSSNDAPTKRSRIQKLINSIIIMILIVDLVMCTVSSLIEIFGFVSNTELYYLRQESENTFKFPTYIANVCTFIVLYSSLLPISLLFCMTLSNFFQAMFMHWDLDMYHEDTDTPATCNNMELVQELGQVSYLFSDKTGTLTRNEMKLVGCSVGGKTYGIGNGAEGTASSSACALRDIFRDVITCLQDEASENTDRELVFDFFMVLAVCHTVLVDTTSGIIQYNAEGPDEEALVSAAADIGIRLVATDGGKYAISVDCSDKAYDLRTEIREKIVRAKSASNASRSNKGSSNGEDTAEDDDDEEEEDGPLEENLDDLGPTVEFEILAINHFNSTRKRMSVVCKDPDGRIMLLVKGADTAMFQVATSFEEEEFSRKELTAHMDAFANDGLRTLVMAKRELTQQEFDEWKVKFDEASNALGEKRATLLDEAAEEIERDLVVIGASAIEDRLQDGVPETLVALREAGVKTWVLTGDKVETAINIAFSARLLSPEMELVKITNDENDENIHTLRELHRLLVPQNLCVDSEERKKGRAVKLQEGGNPDVSIKENLGKVAHSVHAWRDTMEKAGRSTIHSVERAGRVALNVVTLKQFRSPTEESSDQASPSGFKDTAQGSDRATSSFDVVPEVEDEHKARRKAAKSLDGGAQIRDLEVELEADKQDVDDVVAPGIGRPRASTDTTGIGPKVAKANRGGEVKAPTIRTTSRRKRPSMPSFSRLWSSMSSATALNEAKSPKGHYHRPSTTWNGTQQPLPLGVDDKDDNHANIRELQGNEANLDGFEAQNMALVISGGALRGMMSEELGSKESEQLLLSIARLCSVVVACRVSPKQKALLVRMVKNGVVMEDGQRPITLAIGDGANDVAMIQEARVGVGISGHEGRQAVNSADFAIAQFRFLQQLMLVHGRWNYRRAASLVLFIFYSNILFVLTAFVFNFFNKFSGSALYWVFLTTVYAYPSQVPIAVIACFNQDISRKTALEYPAMYISGRNNLHLNKVTAIEYIVKAFFHAFLISSLSIIWGAPSDINISAMGTTVYMACIWVCVSRSCLETYTWTWINFGAVFFGFFSMLIFEPIYYGGDLTIFVRFGSTVMWAVGQGEPSYMWYVVILITAMCTAYDVVTVYIRKEFFPSVLDVVIEIDRNQNEEEGQRKSRLLKINKVFRRLAQPLTIPAVAISEVLAAANLSNIGHAANRSAFDYDHPEDERLRSLVKNLLSGFSGQRKAIKLSNSRSSEQSVVAKSEPIKIIELTEKKELDYDLP